MPQGVDPLLMAAAEEELSHACTLGWAALARVTPWGDVFDGYAPGGKAVRFERNYLWQAEKGGDILVEVTAYAGETRHDQGVRLSCLIRKA